MRETILIADNLDSLFVVIKVTLCSHTCKGTSQHFHHFLWSHFNQPVVTVPRAIFWQLSCDFSSPALAFQGRDTSLPGASFAVIKRREKRFFRSFLAQTFFIDFLTSSNIFHIDFFNWLQSLGRRRCFCWVFLGGFVVGFICFRWGFCVCVQKKRQSVPLDTFNVSVFFCSYILVYSIHFLLQAQSFFLENAPPSVLSQRRVVF